jgi:hypothetical protein
MAVEVEQFQRGLQRAVDRARLVLDQARSPVFAADVHHQYQDKYILVETMTNAALASYANWLGLLGVSQEQLVQMCGWAKTNAVSLRFRTENGCTFLRETTREVESAKKEVVEASIGGSIRSALTSKTVTKVTEYIFKYESSYELMAVRGVGASPDDILSIQKRSGSIELERTSKSLPYPEKRCPAHQVEVNVSVLIKLLQADSAPVVPTFLIDRSSTKCHTPRRNAEIDACHAALSALRTFANDVCRCVNEVLSPGKGLSGCDRDSFVPVLPCLVDTEQQALLDDPASSTAVATPANLLACLTRAVDPSGNALGVMDINNLLVEERRKLDEIYEDLRKVFPASDHMVSATEAILYVTMRHYAGVAQTWFGAIDYIECMLRKQLIAAIGKEVMPWDFADYMTFHNRKLFAEAYAPIPFCFAVRRSSQHSPEGTLSIEQENFGGESTMASPILTTTAHSTREHYMQFPISASTNVSFGGDKYLHAWLNHKFSGESGSNLSLVAKTRQFSSMIVLVGRISSAKTFEPKYAAIVRNKDELKIPLELSTIPTPKEFKDAIESLSPEQQAFAKAFRSMQLESTLFGIVCIQIKPQLEKVLNLQGDSLTKEIKLTQELMELFITYQIPSDLLAFDEHNTVNEDGLTVVAGGAADKLKAVKRHVAAMYEMINKSKQEEIQGRQMEAAYSNPLLLRQRSNSSLFSDDMSADECEEEERCSFEAAPVMAMKSASAPRSMMKKSLAGSAVNKAARGVMDRAKGMASAIAPKLSRQSSRTESQAMDVDGASPGEGGDFEVLDANTTEQGSQKQPQGKQDHIEEESAMGRDYTKVPKEIEANLESLDVDGQVRPTIINPSSPWTKTSQKALLASPTTSWLEDDDQKKEKDAAFDLLDALTKSGAIPVEHASLHVVIAATHCFDKSVLETLVQDNVNPIDKVERSTLIMATTVHQQPAAALIKDSQALRVKDASPMLFDR